MTSSNKKTASEKKQDDGLPEKFALYTATNGSGAPPLQGRPATKNRALYRDQRERSAARRKDDQRLKKSAPKTKKQTATVDSKKSAQTSKEDVWKYVVKVNIEAPSTAVYGIAEQLAKIFPTASWNTDYEFISLLTSTNKPPTAKTAEVKKIVEERRGAIKRAAIAVVHYYGDF